MKLLQIIALALAPHPCPPPCVPTPCAVYQPAFQPIPPPAICHRRLDPVDDCDEINTIEMWAYDEADAEAEYWQQAHPGCRGYAEVYQQASDNARHWAQGVWGEAIY